MGQNFAAWSGSSCITTLVTADFCDRTSSRKSLMYSLRFCSCVALAEAAALAGAGWDCVLSWARTAAAKNRNANIAKAALFLIILPLLKTQFTAWSGLPMIRG